VSPYSSVVIDIFGEGRTDVGDDPRPQPPAKGVVPILVHTLCGRPPTMFVKRHGMPFMQQRGTLRQKVRFAKRQARLGRSAGAAFVVDSEGDLRERLEELNAGRRMEPGEFPMAVGVAHPCIEAWLLADANALRRALELPANPDVPESPEDLPAPRQDRRNNPKTVLARIAGSRHQDLDADAKHRIAAAMNDMPLVRQRCPLGFDPFAGEVEQHLKPLF